MKWHKVLQMGKKHCGKRRNYLLRAISLFPLVFLKDVCWRQGLVLERVRKSIPLFCLDVSTFSR